MDHFCFGTFLLVLFNQYFLLVAVYEYFLLVLSFCIGTIFLEKRFAGGAVVEFCSDQTGVMD